MSDIVERLRSGAEPWGSRAPSLCAEAADEIERLRAEVAELKAAMTKEPLNESWAAWCERHGVANDFEVHPLGTVERLRAERDAAIRAVGAHARLQGLAEAERDRLRAELAEANTSVQHYVARVNSERERAERAEAELAERTAAVIVSESSQALACSASVAASYGTLRDERDRLRAELAAYKEAVDTNDSAFIDRMTAENTRLRAELAAVTEKYRDLLLSVGNKYEGESRHDTAKRYILNSEKTNNQEWSGEAKEKP